MPPYVGEIRMFGGNFAPSGWAFCEGQLLSISENETLFTLIGTTYGGDGKSTFALPDLRGRIPIHQDASFTMGQTGGVESVTLTVNQVPAHNHAMMATEYAAEETTPQNNVSAEPTNRIYAAPTATVAMGEGISPAGGGRPHDNMQPFLSLSFIISLFGEFPNPS